MEPTDTVNLRSGVGEGHPGREGTRSVQGEKAPRPPSSNAEFIAEEVWTRGLGLGTGKGETERPPTSSRPGESLELQRSHRTKRCLVALVIHEGTSASESILYASGNQSRPSETDSQ